MNLSEYFLKNETIAVQQEATHWKEAVHLATEPLEKLGVITNEYTDAIIRNAKKNGPYFLILPGFAMPHAEPEAGVLATGFSLITLKEPVVFGHTDHDPVDIILCIAAADRKTLNEDVIIQVMNFIDDDETFPVLRNARNVEEIRQFIQRKFGNEI